MEITEDRLVKTAGADRAAMMSYPVFYSSGNFESQDSQPLQRRHTSVTRIKDHTLVITPTATVHVRSTHQWVMAAMTRSVFMCIRSAPELRGM
jgi:hypothetical protein